MAKLKITFRKEIWADLNNYYPNFPVALRKQIDNAIYKLLGGQETKAPTNIRLPSSEGATDAIILRRTTKACTRVNSKLGAVLAQYKPGSEILKDDLIKLASNQHGMQASSAIHHFIRGNYFEIVK